MTLLNQKDGACDISSMVKGDTWTPYKPLAVRRYHAYNMKVILACIFGVVVLTGITGHLFSRREASTSPPPSLNPHHEALAKLIRTSEDAIGWIGNKTIDSINNIKNLTVSAVTPDSPLVLKKNELMNWLRGVAKYNSAAATSTTTTGSAESPETQTKVGEDSGESVVIAHRTPGHGFSWGPPKDTKSDKDHLQEGLLQAAGRRVHSVLSYLYHTSRNFTKRGRAFLQSRVNKGTPPVDVDEPCGEVTDNVCAVDWGRDVFTIFQNSCWARVYNKLHGTNFSIHDSEICITLFTRHPEKYQQIKNPDS